MKTVEIFVTVLAKTSYAWLVCSGKAEALIPRTEIKDYIEIRKDVVSSIFISEELAKQKGFM